MLNPLEENMAWWLNRKLRAVAKAYRSVRGHRLSAIVLSPRCCCGLLPGRGRLHYLVPKPGRHKDLQPKEVRKVRAVGAVIQRPLAVLIRTTPTNGHFRNKKGELIRAGVMKQTEQGYALTERGRKGAATEDVSLPPTIDWWREKIGDNGIKRRMFDVLVSIYPDYITLERLARELRSTHTNGNFRNQVGALCRANLVRRIKTVSGTAVRCTEVLMDNEFANHPIGSEWTGGR